MLVIDPLYGYQFVLPNKWEYFPPESGQESYFRFEGSSPGNSGDRISLSVTVDSATRTLEDELEKYASIARGFSFTILNKGIISNVHNTEVAYLEYKGTFGSIPIHKYETFFISNGNMIHFTFDFDETLYAIAQQSIMAIRNSIQLTVP